ncbi:site-specific integrase [Clostridium sp. DJ247]|uniref:tyrosine-type recombinase/integrase n=1 Tax=Clostridium sp. DJ247 TaxID=2726188 RepID=UPI0016273DB5|nr:site-specific integrase [Clostridium sp. DJ247]MBC2579866.1 site-specific integrase [Clostridium sp. DJ247]
MTKGNLENRQNQLKEQDYCSVKSIITSNIREKYNYISYKNIYRWSLPNIIEYFSSYKHKKIDNTSLYSKVWNYLDAKRGKVLYRYPYINTLIKVTLFYLYILGEIELSYVHIEYLASDSTVLFDFMKRIMNFNIIRDDYKDIRFDMLVIVMFKNKIVKIEDLNNDMIREYKKFLNTDKSTISSHVDMIFNLENKLFLKGILKENAVYTEKKLVGRDDYFTDICNLELKNAMFWYMDNTRASKRSVKKFPPHLIHFAKYIDKNYRKLSICHYNSFIADTYKEKLQMDIDIKLISSRNWAYNCIGRINHFLNFLIDNNYSVHPINRDIFLPNIFDDRHERKAVRRQAIPEYIVSRIKNKLSILDKAEKAIITIYLETGIRLNELSLISLEDIHKDAKELLMEDVKDLEDGIGWIKVISPKIKGRERIVLISKETYEAFQIIKQDRINRFKDIGAILHKSYPELGRRNYFILNKFGLPYISMDSKVGHIIEKLNICDDDGSAYKITAHQFRHTFLTNLMRCGCPIHVAMDLMGHVTASMTQYYDQFEKDSQDIIYEEKLMEDDIAITVNEENIDIIIPGKDLNKLHEINIRYRKRGGFCCTDEFQDECVNIDCIDCLNNNFKSNFTFREELNKSMIMYFEMWSNEKYDSNNKAIYFLYLSRLYEKMLTKVEAFPDEVELMLSKAEKEEISRIVGLK